MSAFTAGIQTGTIGAVLVYFRADIARLVRVGVREASPAERRRDADWREAWCVILVRSRSA